MDAPLGALDAESPAPFWKEWLPSSEGDEGSGARVCEGWTSTGSQPPGACLIFEDSMPRKRGIEGPVKSMSRMPTEWPVRERERAS